MRRSFCSVIAQMRASPKRGKRMCSSSWASASMRLSPVRLCFATWMRTSSLLGSTSPKARIALSTTQRYPFIAEDGTAPDVVDRDQAIERQPWTWPSLSRNASPFCIMSCQSAAKDLALIRP